MSANQLRCKESVIGEGDNTGESAIECGAVALACADCHKSAGCEEHAQFCPKCGQPVCVWCEDEHGCPANAGDMQAA